MENRKNLCAMIPEALYERVGEEKGTAGNDTEPVR